jgi:hypothetical protein
MFLARCRRYPGAAVPFTFPVLARHSRRPRRRLGHASFHPRFGFAAASVVVRFPLGFSSRLIREVYQRLESQERGL